MSANARRIRRDKKRKLVKKFEYCTRICGTGLFGSAYGYERLNWSLNYMLPSARHTWSDFACNGFSFIVENSAIPYNLHAWYNRTYEELRPLYRQMHSGLRRHDCNTPIFELTPIGVSILAPELVYYD